MLQEMKDKVVELKKSLEDMRAQVRGREAWAQAPKMIVWQAIHEDLAAAFERATLACIRIGNTDIQMREYAAEARVYSELLARPEKAVLELQELAKHISATEAEIRNLEGITKGA